MEDKILLVLLALGVFLSASSQYVVFEQSDFGHFSLVVHVLKYILDKALSCRLCVDTIRQPGQAQVQLPSLKAS